MLKFNDINDNLFCESNQTMDPRFQLFHTFHKVAKWELFWRLPEVNLYFHFIVALFRHGIRNIGGFMYLSFRHLMFLYLDSAEQ